MSKVKRGTAAEYLVKAHALLEHFNVFSEGNQDSKCDLILEKSGKLYRVQVKIVDPQGKLPTRKLTHSKTQHKQSWYTKADIDYFAAVDLVTFDVYMFPVTFTQNFSSSISVQLHGELYRNNFNLQEPYVGNDISALPQVGETFGNGNTELGHKPSVETLRGASKGIFIPDVYGIPGIDGVKQIYDEDKVQTPNTFNGGVEKRSE